MVTNGTPTREDIREGCCFALPYQGRPSCGVRILHELSDRQPKLRDSWRPGDGSPPESGNRKRRGCFPQSLAADTAYGSGELLAWLEEQGIASYISVREHAAPKSSLYGIEKVPLVRTCPRILPRLFAPPGMAKSVCIDLLSGLPHAFCFTNQTHSSSKVRRIAYIIPFGSLPPTITATPTPDDLARCLHALSAVGAPMHLPFHRVRHEVLTSGN